MRMPLPVIPRRGRNQVACSHPGYLFPFMQTQAGRRVAGPTFRNMIAIAAGVPVLSER